MTVRNDLMEGRRQVRIGLDLDGTIIVYDRLFQRRAIEEMGMPESVPPEKAAVRDWIRSSPAGEAGWIELQRLVYGPGILDASPAPGVSDFITTCRDVGVAVCVVSHKTALSAGLPRVDLRAAARLWLERNGLVGEVGIPDDAVFFESTRAEKLERIRAQGCSLFVDDLPEVLGDPDFPRSVERWLYAPHVLNPPPGVQGFSDWAVLARRVRELASSA